MMFSNSMDAIYIVDKDGKIIDVNDVACETLGYTKEEFLSMTPEDINAPDTQTGFKKNWEETKEKGFKIFESVHLTKDNNRIPVEVSVRTIDYKGVPALMTAVRDITERKIAEESMRLQSGIMSNMTEGVNLVRASDDLIVYTNPKFDQMFGYKEGELIEKHISIINDPMDKNPEKTAREIIDALNKNGEWHGEIKNIKKNGTPFWCHANVSSFDHHDYGTVFIAVHTDITEQKRAKEALRESEEKYRNLFDNANDAIYTVKLKGDQAIIVDCNRRMLKMLGLKKEEVIGRTPSDFSPLVHRDKRTSDEKATEIKEAALSGKTKRIEWCFKRADGTLIDVDASTSRINIGNETYIQIIARDITEQKKAEEERKDHLHFLESIDKINQVIQQTIDLDNMMSGILNAVLSVFDCDRAFLLYPCDPDTKTWSVPMARNKPDWPGLKPADEVPITPEVSEVFKTASESREPVIFDPTSDRFIPFGEEYNIKSLIVMVIYPRTGDAWLFGAHQCTHPRIWSEKDAKIFKEIGYKITNALSNALLYDDLHKSESKYKTLFNSASDAIFIHDMRGNFLEVNDVAINRYGYSKEEFLNLAPMDLDVPEMATKVSERIKELEEKGNIIFEGEQVSKDGRKIPVEVSSIVTKYEQKPAIISITRDISERKRAEKEIGLHEVRLKSMLELNKMLEAPEDEIMNFVNEELIKITLSKFSFIGLLNEDESVFILNAYSKSVMKECLTQYKLTHFPVKEAGIWAKAIRDRGATIINDYENMDIDKKGYPGGHVSLTRILSVPIFDGKKVVALACVANKEKDYTESDKRAVISMLNDMWRLIQRKRAELEKKDLWQQLLQSQKLESIGRLTGGIAHDFNNILTGILGYGELALRDLSDDNPLHKRLKIIIENSEKAANLIRQLLAFSRKQMLDARLNNLNIIVDNMASMLKRVIGEDIRLDLALGTSVSNVIVDETQIEQVLMNLAVNARDAMPHGGYLKIGTEDISVDKEYARMHEELRPGNYVMLSVEDTGTGMSEEVKGKIFEPFFTTKEKGKGTGLGLSTVFGIVKQHNGSISIYSEADKGTRFVIYLPVAKGIVQAMNEEDNKELTSGNETILIVDDDTIICGMAREVLEGLNYKILTAGDGDDAIRLCEDYKDRIDLLITDVVMHGMNGWEIANELKVRRPEIKVIFTSGYMDNPIVLKNIVNHKMPFINKPFKPCSLVKKIREVLDEKYEKKSKRA